MAAVNAVVAAGRAMAAKQVRQKGWAVMRKGINVPKKGTNFKSLNKEDPATAALTKSLTRAFKNAMKPDPKPPPSLMEKLGGHMKQMQETVGALGIQETLRSFGDATVGAAADLESSRIGFDFLVSKLGGGAKGKDKGKGPTSSQDLEKSFADYWTALRENARATAFSAKDVLSGGMKAVKLTKGDTKQAMQLVKLAEDMAAFNPGKSVKDAMDAIAAAKNQDYSKMKDFGLEFKKGSWNSFLKTADSWFKGGAEKLNTSANGMWEIVTEGIKDSLQNAGVAALEQVKPVMLKMVNWLNNGGFKKLESLAAKTVDVFVKSFLWMMDVLGPVFGWLEGALDWIGKNFDTLRPILNGLIAAFAAFAVISSVMSIISGVGTFIALLSNPIFWVVAAIGLLTAAWTGNWLGIRDITKSAVNGVVAAYQSLKQSISQFVQDTKQLLADLGAWIEHLWTEASAFVMQTGKRIASWASQTWDEVYAATAAALSKAWNAVRTAFGNVRSVVVGVLTQIYDFHAMVWDALARIVVGAGSFIVDTVASAFRAIGGVVGDAFDTIVGIGRAGIDLLRGIFDGVWKGAVGDHAGAVESIKQAFLTAFGKVGALLSGFVSRARGYAAGFVKGYFSGLQSLSQTVVDVVKPVGDSIASAYRTVAAFAAMMGERIEAGFRAVVEAAEQGWRRFSAAAVRMKDEVVAYVQTTVSAFLGYVDSSFSSMVERGKQFLANLKAAFEQGLTALRTYVSLKLKEIEESFWNAMKRAGEAIAAGWQAIVAWVTDGMRAMWDAIAPALQSINEFTSLLWGIVIGTFMWGVRIVSDVMTSFIDTAASFGERFMTNLIEGFATMKDALLQKVSEIWDSVASIFGGTSAKVNLSVQPIHGSHRTGLNRVPFDGYIAQLHRGEMVLTSGQADAYRGGQLSAEQRASMLQPYGLAAGAAVNQTKHVEIANLIGEMHVHDEADENRFIEKLKRMLEEDLLTEGEGVYAG